MRRTLIQVGALVILLVCIGAHISELFDSWDNTLETGNDIESSLVLVAGIVGFVLVSATLTVGIFRGSRNSSAPAGPRVYGVSAFHVLVNVVSPSPPLSLRI
jgi:hypothetical protein